MVELPQKARQNDAFRARKSESPRYDSCVTHLPKTMRKEINPLVVARMLAISAAFFACGQALACDPNLPASMVAQADGHIAQNRPSKAYGQMMSQAMSGSGGAYTYVGAMYEKGRGVSASSFMSRHMYWMGSQFNDPEALFKTANDFYSRGFRSDGEYFAKRAIDCGHSGAVGLLLRNLLGEGRDSEARALLEEGINDSIPEVKFILAELYENGKLGLPRDPKRAFAWYYMASKDGYVKAMTALAYYFVRGLHGEQDDLAARYWYHKAAISGSAEAMTAYGWMLVNGRGGEADPEEGRYYLKSALKAGDVNASAILKSLDN